MLLQFKGRETDFSSQFQRVTVQHGREGILRSSYIECEVKAICVTKHQEVENKDEIKNLDNTSKSLLLVIHIYQLDLISYRFHILRK